MEKKSKPKGRITLDALEWLEFHFGVKDHALDISLEELRLYQGAREVVRLARIAYERQEAEAESSATKVQME